MSHDAEKVDDIKEHLLKIFNYVQKKYVFIRIPKTGSASMNASLWNATESAHFQRKKENVNVWLQAPGKNSTLGGWWDHYSAQFCARSLGNFEWENTISFSMVRNPFARLYSMWKYEELHTSFKEWLISGAQFSSHRPHHDLVYPKNHMLSQKSWLADSDNNLMVNFVFRLEEVEEIAPSALSQIIDSRFRLYTERINQTSKPGEYIEHYDNEMIDFVYKNCKDDLETFHYEFDTIKEPSWFYWNGTFNGLE